MHARNMIIEDINQWYEKLNEVLQIVSNETFILLPWRSRAMLSIFEYLHISDCHYKIVVFI